MAEDPGSLSGAYTKLEKLSHFYGSINKYKKVFLF